MAPCLLISRARISQSPPLTGDPYHGVVSRRVVPGSKASTCSTYVEPPPQHGHGDHADGSRERRSAIWSWRPPSTPAPTRPDTASSRGHATRRRRRPPTRRETAGDWRLRTCAMRAGGHRRDHPRSGHRSRSPPTGDRPPLAGCPAAVTVHPHVCAVPGRGVERLLPSSEVATPSMRSPSWEIDRRTCSPCWTSGPPRPYG